MKEKSPSGSTDLNTSQTQYLEVNDCLPELHLPEIPKELNPRQACFAKEYFLNGRNATQAAISAGYSAKSARRHATRLLSTNVHIQRYFRDVYQVWSQNVEHVLMELAGVGFTDLTDYGSWDTDGQFTLKDSEEIPAFHMKALKELNYEHRRETHGKGDNEYTVEVHSLKLKLHDKIKALSEIRRHLGGGADAPEDPQKAGEGVTVLLIGGPFGFERQEPAEQMNIEENDESTSSWNK